MLCGQGCSVGCVVHGVRGVRGTWGAGYIERVAGIIIHDTLLETNNNECQKSPAKETGKKIIKKTHYEL